MRPGSGVRSPASTRRWAASTARSWLAVSRRAAARRVRWGLVDQAVSSLTNFGITLVVAREVSPSEFGVFAVGLTVYVMLLWASRSLATEPFVVRFTSAPLDEQRAAASQAVGTACALGSIAACVMLTIGVAGDDLTLRVMVAMAVGMPGLLVQDAFRYVLFASGRARSAAANDLIWLTGQTGLVALALATQRVTAVTMALAFGASATVAAVVASRQTGVLPSPRSSWTWVRRYRHLGVPFFLELVAVTGMMQIALLAVATTAGAATLGALRAAMLLMGPLTVLFMGLLAITIPEAIRLLKRSSRALMAMVVGLGVTMPAAAALWALAVLLLPRRLGVELLGANWDTARDLLVPVAVLIAGHGCALAAIVGLRALGAARDSLGARLWGAPLFLIGGLVGSHLGGAHGAAVGLAGAALVDAALAWTALRRVVS